MSQTSKRGFEATYDYGFHGRNLQANRPDLSTRKVAPAEVVGLADVGAGEGTEASPAPYVRPSAVVARFTDGNNNTTTYELDPLGGATMAVDALSRTTVIERDGDGLATRITWPNTRVDELTYDAQGNQLARTEGFGTVLARTTTFEYEPVFNQVTKIVDPELNETLMGYDSAGNLVSLTNAHLTVTALIYGDANCPGLTTSVTRAQGLPEEATSNFTYDPATCNRTQESDPLSNQTSLTYDSAGNVAQIIDAELRATSFQHDLLNRRTKIIDATNAQPDPACGTTGVTCLAYNTAGNLESLTDANDNVTSFSHDELDRIIQRLDPLGLPTTIDYDGTGKVEAVTDRKGQATELGYDADNRLTSQTFQPGAPDEFVRTITYDVSDSITSITDPDSALAFTYDLLNRLESTSTTGSPFQPDVTLTYGYDGNDNRVSLDDGTQTIASYVYDALDRLTNLQAPGGDFVFSYDALSRRTSITRDNGVATAYTYDLVSRLTSIAHDLSGAPVSSFTYGLDGIGKRTNLDQVRPSLPATASIAYVYDDLDELTSATSALSGGTSESYAYDPVGNRETSHLSAGHVTGAGNRLLEDDAFCYGYDANGNLATKTAKLAGACAGGVTIYTWDADDRLARIDFPTGNFAAYRYDGLGRRIEKNVDGAATRYVYDRADILLQYDGTNTLLARYTHGPRDDEPLLIQRDQNSDGVFQANEGFLYHTDGLGSITEITDDVGTVVASMLYDGYGNVLAQTGTLPQPYAFTGRELDQESGHYHYRARYYDPRLGRFLAEDPIGLLAGDPNVYRYVLNNPLNNLDPSGLFVGDLIDLLCGNDDPCPRDYFDPEEVDIIELSDGTIMGIQPKGLPDDVKAEVIKSLEISNKVIKADEKAKRKARGPVLNYFNDEIAIPLTNCFPPTPPVFDPNPPIDSIGTRG